MTAQNAIDLSKLSPPLIIEDLSFDAIFNEMVAEVQKQIPEFLPLKSDPITKIIDVCAYRILTEKQARNEALKQNLIAYATGANLDNLGANLLVSRLPNENDDDFRARIILAPESFSTAGPNAAYVFHAKSAHAEVGDVRVSSPNPKEVLIAVLGNTTLAPPQEALDAVLAKCSADSVRPITDFVQVQAAEIINFQIDATITTYLGPDVSIVLNNARASLDQYLSQVQRIGHDITTSMIIAALGVPGVQKIVLNAPATDILISDTQAPNCTSISIAAGGVGE